VRIAMLSKACIVGAYQKKLEHLAKLPDVDLIVLVPPAWRDNRGKVQLEWVHTEGYELRPIPLVLNGHFHLHIYPTLHWHLQSVRPDIVHIDEEPYNLATWQAMRSAMRLGARACFFTWQNLYRRYPPPFSWIERFNYRHASHAIAGSRTATEVLRRKGYRGAITVIPQFGIDPEDFRPVEEGRGDRDAFVIGYAGGLVEEKGVDLLLRAAARLQGHWQVLLAGEGAQKGVLMHLAERLGISDRVRFLGRIPSTSMPRFYQQLDVLVLPSRTRPRWSEQFGRVLVEAMACGVPVIGSTSGEIPEVIGEAGLLFTEGDIEGLLTALQRLMAMPALRRELGAQGRARSLHSFTHKHIAEATYQVYRQMLESDEG
jgi:glycosyltransferase involved in cell wall biosynthesis